jgi:hypothetical protein
LRRRAIRSANLSSNRLSKNGILLCITGSALLCSSAPVAPSTTSGRVNQDVPSDSVARAIQDHPHFGQSIRMSWMLFRRPRLGSQVNAAPPSVNLRSVRGSTLPPRAVTESKNARHPSLWAPVATQRTRFQITSSVLLTWIPCRVPSAHERC